MSDKVELKQNVGNPPKTSRVIVLAAQFGHGIHYKRASPGILNHLIRTGTWR